jgi:transposase-like protein
MMVSIQGQRMYLWRAVDSEGEVLDLLVQAKRDTKAALRLMQGSTSGHSAPCNSAALPSTPHETSRASPSSAREERPPNEITPR